MEQETKKCPYCGEEILAIAKKCKHCGEWLNKDEKQDEEKAMIPCPVCGEMVEEDINQCPYCHESLVEDALEPTEKKNINSERGKEPRSFFDYYFVEPFIKQYFKFKGRINRKHFWISILLWTLLSALVVLIMEIGQNGSVFPVVYILYLGWFLLSIIPIWAAVLRRMKDGDSELGYWGWWFYILPLPYTIMILTTSQNEWLCLIPFIILLWWLKKPSDNLMRNDGLAPDEEQKVAFKKSDKITVCAIILVVMGLLLASNTNSSDENVQTEKQSQIEEQTIANNATQDIKAGYLYLLNKYATMAKKSDEYGFLCSYFLFDITGDGIPEVWIKSGSCEADYKLSVYTYDKAVSLIQEGEEGDAGHSAFYEGDNYILQVSGHMGYASWVKLTYNNGEIKYDVVFEEDLNESGKDDYTEPSEKPIEEYPVDDTSPIEEMFNK